MTDLLGGQVQVTFDVMPSSIEYIRAGKLRAPAVTTDTRSQALPNLHERFLAGLRGKLPYGMAAPKNTAAEILHKLNNEINAAMADPKMMARLAEMGGLMQPGSPASFDKFVAAKTEKSAKVGEICGHQAGVIRVMSGGWHPVPQNCDNGQRYSRLQREFGGL